MRGQVQLIAYVDRLPGGTLRDLERLLDGPLNGVFGGLHVLPFFYPIDGADAGFDPIDHTQVDPRLGTWDDLASLADRTDVMADVIVNHVSSRSPRFLDYLARGEDSPFAGMFLTYARLFPEGARSSDLLALHTPRPTLPFTRYQTARGAQLCWTTFTSDQIDIDVAHPQGRRYLTEILERFGTAGVKVIRLDAVGYAVKKAGSSCFMIPETFAFIADVTAQAHARGMEVLVEVHGYYQDVIDVARQVDWVYDFALPPLVLHTLYTRDATALTRWIGIRPRNSVTVLDTHDGIGVADAGGDRKRPGAHGLLSPDELEAVVETIHGRSRGESRQASGNTAGNIDSSQINCTFYDALGRDDNAYLMARAIQCFVPGVPQIYYVGLLAGGNDLDLLRRTGVGRDINRHYYAAEEFHGAMARTVVKAVLELLRLRNTHPAFGGSFRATPSLPDRIELEWSHGDALARLEVDLARMHASIACSDTGTAMSGPRMWKSSTVS